MSTTFEVLKRETPAATVTFEITEQSSRFEISAQRIRTDAPADAWPEDISIPGLSAEEVVDIAMKLLQPALYNVADPRAFMETVIKKRLGELFV